MVEVVVGVVVEVVVEVEVEVEVGVGVVVVVEVVDGVGVGVGVGVVDGVEVGMKKSTFSESLIQQWFIKWTWINYRKYPELRLGFAVPNGAWTKNVALAMKLKREGLRPGVPDWMLPIARTWHGHLRYGLAIEFKRPGGKLTQAQIEYHDQLYAEGWTLHICSDWKNAAELVEEYLK